MLNNEHRKSLKKLIEDASTLRLDYEGRLPYIGDPMEKSRLKTEIENIDHQIETWRKELGLKPESEQPEIISLSVPKRSERDKWFWPVFIFTLAAAGFLIVALVFVLILTASDADQQRKDANQLRATITAIANIPPLTATVQAAQAHIAVLERKIGPVFIVDESGQPLPLIVDKQHSWAGIGALDQTNSDGFVNFKTQTDFYISNDSPDKNNDQWVAAFYFRHYAKDGYNLGYRVAFNTEGTLQLEELRNNRIVLLDSAYLDRSFLRNSVEVPTRLTLYVFGTEVYFCADLLQANAKPECAGFSAPVMGQSGNIVFSVWNNYSLTGKNAIFYNNFKVWSLDNV